MIGESSLWIIVRGIGSSLRPHYWFKNLIVFFPAILGHRLSAFFSPTIYLTFICFSLLASSVYLFNDVSDAPMDARHPLKKLRPVAAGLLDLRIAIGASLALA